MESKMKKEGTIRHDRNDPKWGHPELESLWSIDGTPTVIALTDIDVPVEEKKKLAAEIMEGGAQVKKEQMDNNPELRDSGVTTEYIAPGCPEEPDTSVKVVVRTPTNRTSEKLPVIFYVCGGALVLCSPALFPLERLCKEMNAVVVCPVYRVSYEAPYPAAINDLHAGYKWVVDNAEKLGIDPDRIVITGTSSGGHLAAALPFRLKRYGYHPRGTVVTEPITEDRMIYESQKVGLTAWDGEQMHQALSQWMGHNDYNSPYVGPEAFANHATVEDCKGLCPYFILTAEHDPDRDPSMAFAQKLYEANVYTEIHVWGGAGHAHLFGAENIPYGQRYYDIYFGNIRDCLQYDLRRLWLNEG